MTKIMKPGSSLEIFENIKKILMEGKLVGLPTETVYGLGADATNNQAISKIFALKNRPSFNPLICHFSNVNQILQYCQNHPLLDLLATNFWPGSLTVVLKLTTDSSISSLATAGLNTLAVRIPDHPIALEVIERLGRPIAAPSANMSETISPTAAEHVLKNFDDELIMPIILDGGPCRVGIESTIVSLVNTEPTILRLGAIGVDELKVVLPNLLESNSSNNQRINAPGMMKRHYAPSIPLRLNVNSVSSNEALLAFGEHNLIGAHKVMNLSPSADINEAAANLYRMLFELDKPQYSAIAVMPIPCDKIGYAINDRLQRAACITGTL